jgi:zinc transporter, ZIP family
MNQRTLIPFFRLAFYVTAPLLLLGLAAIWLVSSDPLKSLSSATPPIENITFERVVLDDEGIHLKIRASGSEPMVIAQVQVDDAYWAFKQTPSGPLPRMSSAEIDIPYPWVEGDAIALLLVSNTGATFAHEIEVAVPTLTGQSGRFRIQALVGGFVGVLPVVIGMLFFPLLVRLRAEGMRFVLSLTLGMLAFLLIDVLGEAFEFAAKTTAGFQGAIMVWLVVLVSCLGLIAIGRRDGAPSALAVAFFISLGIGLHNLGEGLAIGAALASGGTALGTFLILGFTIHNVTEGIAIAAPLTKNRPHLIVFAGLALLAGSPAILGIWLGSYAIAPQWAAMAMAVGAGAVLQVIFEVGLLTRKDGVFTLDRYQLGGLVMGIAFMYFTGMAIKV